MLAQLSTNTHHDIRLQFDDETFPWVAHCFLALGITTTYCDGVQGRIIARGITMHLLSTFAA